MKYKARVIIGVAALLVVLTSCIIGSAATVTNTNDSGPGSLRQAIADAAPGDTITFVVTGTITLTSDRLIIDRTLTIRGPGADLLSISGNDAVTVFFINTDGTVVLDGLTISNGRSIAGGGIWNQFATLTVTNCTISGNIANADPSIGGGGGGIYNANGILALRNTIVSGNSSTDSCGGGIFSGAGFGGVAALTVTNSTISGNTAGYSSCGGGIFHRVFDGTASMNVISSTISGNSSGIYAQGSTQTLMNSIVAGNGGLDIDDGTIDSASHNLIGDTASSGGIVNGVNGNIVGVNPMLGPLQNNGGPMRTFALLAGSPAIGAGDNSLAVDGNGQPLVYDQRGAGFPRIVGGTVDIGAFERQGTTASSVFVSGRVLSSDGRGVRGAYVTISGPSGTRTTPTGRLGVYRFDDVATGADYTISVAARRFRFQPRVLQVFDELTNVDLIAEGLSKERIGRPDSIYGPAPDRSDRRNHEKQNLRQFRNFDTLSGTHVLHCCECGDAYCHEHQRQRGR